MSPLIEAGLNITAIGMGVVFVLLTLLVYIIRGMSALSRRLEGRPAEAPPAPASPGAPVSAPSHQELVGVISAAIAMHRQRQRMPDRER